MRRGLESDLPKHSPYNPSFVKDVQRKRMLEKTRRRMEEAQAAAQKLEADAEQKAAAILARARAAAGEIRGEAGERRSAAQIIAETAIAHGLTVHEIVGRVMAHRAIDARHAAMVRVWRECADLTMQDIGRIFGGRQAGAVAAALAKAGAPL